jgi:glutaredoxin
LATALVLIGAAGCAESRRAVEAAANLAAAATGLLERAAAPEAAEIPSQSAGPEVALPADAPAKAEIEVVRTQPGSELESRTYFQYIDERGTVRFVASRDELPAQWRDRAGTVEMSSMPAERPADRRSEFDRRRARARAVLAQSEPVGGHSGLDDGVFLYYATWCGYCRKAKAHLDERGVEYDLRNVDQPVIMAELESETGSGSIPVVDVGGQLIRGYDPAKMDQLIAAR